MPIDIYADDNESQIRFLAQRVDSLNEQVELLLEMLIVLRDRINVMEKNEDESEKAMFRASADISDIEKSINEHRQRLETLERTEDERAYRKAEGVE